MDPLISEIQIYAFDFAPRNWASCNGQLLAINTNTALFSLLGTTYGGNGTTTFALPDLRGRAALHFGFSQSGSSYSLGQGSGAENHTLTTNEIPPHTHLVNASSSAADQVSPQGNLLAKSGSEALYNASQNATGMASNMIANGGSSQPHPNIQPYLAVNFCIALTGIFPSRN